ncbi:hypothetical protein [Furfurilactobacillus entadae]|uniref:hypothetical protein n=1 Tax=Furfurilactobacillus entadae TaxID=2922307 RepID=UPI0035EC9CCC
MNEPRVFLQARLVLQHGLSERVYWFEVPTILPVEIIEKGVLGLATFPDREAEMLTMISFTNDRKHQSNQQPQGAEADRLGVVLTVFDPDEDPKMTPSNLWPQLIDVNQWLVETSVKNKE